MKIVLEAADQGRFLTQPEIHALLPYTCAYGSLRTSIKFLDRAGVIVRHRSGIVCTIKPTAKAYILFRAG
ncbi:MAG: hypothetical protein EOR96_34505 [Mesorhizobium sp.]|nr:MAG: hypothetical protein EOR96_34505 [Mesorhizobium sp.]